MTGGEDAPEQDRFPPNWDVLQDTDPEVAVAEQTPSEPNSAAPPPTLNVLASSWADAVVILGVCTAAVVGLTAAGHHGSLTVLPWAAALGVAWWTAAATVLLVIRQGTPGMLLAGIVFAGRVAPQRLPVVIGAAVCSALLVGLPGVFGARRSPLAIAAGSELESIPAD